MGALIELPRRGRTERLINQKGTMERSFVTFVETTAVVILATWMLRW